MITSEKLPICLWLESLENEAMEQAKNLANHPYAFKHVAIMPDAHTGFGMPIGGVLALKNAVIPNAVGVDIGCGMCAVRTNLRQISRNQLETIVSAVHKAIPVGFNHHRKPLDPDLLPDPAMMPDKGIVKREFNEARTQIATLGGGNHFIEIQAGSDKFIWIMIHSGSRNVGLKVAEHYNKLAGEINKKQNQEIYVKQQLAYLTTDMSEARDYLQEMQWCVDFAFKNRSGMMKVLKEIFSDVCKDIKFDEMINIAHNYASLENHFGEKVYVHRKGATQASKETIGIIPGSQGTKSYIVKGKGSTESFESCSHGAGRVMSRNQAIKTLDLKKEIEKLERKGIIHGMKKPGDLDEASSAYKNIDEVMKNQEDLVEVMIELTPLAVVKG